MIDIQNKCDCCGCNACIQKCPIQCIRMVEDIEGFLYPHVDKSLCIDCGLCEKVCPLLVLDRRKSNKSNKVYSVLQTLAVKNKNMEERLHSSSGGVFIALAREVIAQGGVVFGAKFDEQWEVILSYAETIEDVRPMLGSKYLQARVENAFCDAEQFLKKGRLVMFSGMPCHIAGLRSFLHKDYDNLLAVDCLCHGVPSPGVWRRYLHEVIPLRLLSEITDIDFRNKLLGGWKKYHFVISCNEALVKNNDAVVYSSNNTEYMKGFISDIYIRPSCYLCMCKNGVNNSDITLGDFWGIDRIIPDFDDDKGVGVVLINTLKGQSIFNKLDVIARELTLDDACRCNAGFKEYVKMHPKRDMFFKAYSKGISVSVAVEKCLYIPLHIRLYRKLKDIIRYINPNL